MSTSHSGGEKLVEGFKRLIPQINTSATDPVQTAIVGAATNIFEYAFEAYTNPKVEGFVNETTNGDQIRYLNYEAAESAFDGCLKIKLEKASNVARSDILGWWDWSDPYVIFSVGSSMVKSIAVQNTKNPHWNSTHYLPLRKKHLKNDFDGMMHVSLYDSDKRGMQWMEGLRKFLNPDDLLGSGILNVKDLKKPGVHSFHMQMGKNSWLSRNCTTVHFTVEYISFKDACMESGVSPESAQWEKGMESDSTVIPDFQDLPWLIDLGSLSLIPIAFIDAPSTDTQAWLRGNLASKILVLSFRGTETAKTKDVLIDLTATKQRFGDICKEDCVLRSTENLMDDAIRVHSGFLKAYISIREAILRLVYDITGWSHEWSICFGGHSLGGALATLAAFEFANRRNMHDEVPVIGMMSFGAPRVGNPDFARIYNKTVPDTFRVVDKDDVIHVLPLRFVHTAKEVLILPSGEVFVEGKPLAELGIGNFSQSRKIESIDDKHDSGSFKEILETYGRKIDEMVDKHLRPNYKSIVRAAIKKFFSPGE